MRNFYSFVGGATGTWRVTRFETLVGSPIDTVDHVEMINAPAARLDLQGSWTLQGFTSNLRYAERAELDRLAAVQEGLNRPAATCAALIPLRKSPAWWAMPQDERRAIFEAQSRHNAIGMEYLPAIARQLHHARDLGEPFDFLTWFEFAPEHTPLFDELLARLRASREWQFIDREIEIRLERAS